MTLTFTTSTQLTNQNGIKILIYGGAGAGKTSLVATLPRPLLISAESGALSLRPQNLIRMYGENNPSVTYDIPIVEINSLTDLTEVYNFLTQSAEAARFDSVAIDSISEIAEKVLANAKMQVKDVRQAYSELLTQMENTVRKFRDLKNKHVYISAKMEPVKDELTGSLKYGLSMPGSKLSPKLPFYFDEFYRLGVNKDPQGNSYRFLQTQPEFQFDAKSRSGALAAVEIPNLTHIISKILGD